MFSLPNFCSSDQAIAIVREYDQVEAARLLAEYPPDDQVDDDTGEFPAVTPDPDAGPLSDDEWAAVVMPELEEDPPYEPNESDRAWLAPLDLADIAEDRAMALAWLAMLEALHPGPCSDLDLISAGLPVG